MKKPQEIKIPKIYEENIIEVAYRNADVYFKYYDEKGKIYEIVFQFVYQYDYVESEYMEFNTWDEFGLVVLGHESEYIQKLVRDMTDRDLQRYFGGEYAKLKHYRLIVDDVGMYNFICKGMEMRYV